MITKDEEIVRKNKDIETKDREINDIKKILTEHRILQYVGIGLSIDTSEFENKDEVSSDLEISSESKSCFKCELCNFETKHKSGLKIHIGKNQNHNVKSVQKCLKMKKSLKDM